MNLSERIKMARKQAGLTQKELAIRVEVSQTAVHKLESGRSKASRHTVAIALTCGVDPIWLDTGRGEMSLIGSTPGMSQAELAEAAGKGELHRAQLFARLPLISWEDASQSCEEPIESFHPTALAWLPIAPKTSDRTFALRVPDDSMEPEFQEGEMILIDPTLPGKHNQFVIARMEGDSLATFKQLTLVGSRTYLKPLNPRYPLIDVQGGIRVCGVVVGKFKDY
ncbi:MAG: XRE family transcriptional regulator [Magnetococcus sp. YQC-3]